MELIAGPDLAAYLAAAPLVDRDAPEIVAWVDEHLAGCTPEEAARRVFHLDAHSFTYTQGLPGALSSD